MCNLMHDELVRLLHPLVLDDKLDFLRKLFKVSILYKFDEDWLLSCRSEYKLGKHEFLTVGWWSVGHLARDYVLDALQ